MFFVSGVTDKNGHVFTVQQELRASMLYARRSHLDENIQVNGHSFIVDFTGYGTKHLAHMSIEDMRNSMNCWQVS